MAELRMILTSLHPRWWRKYPPAKHLPRPYYHP